MDTPTISVDSGELPPFAAQNWRELRANNQGMSTAGVFN